MVVQDDYPQGVFKVMQEEIDELKQQRDALLVACKRAKDYLESSSKLDWDDIITPILDAAIATCQT